jgi:hypothetical protein
VKRLHALRAKGEADEQQAISDLPAAIMRGGLTFTIIVMVAHIGWSIGVNRRFVVIAQRTGG